MRQHRKDPPIAREYTTATSGKTATSARADTLEARIQGGPPLLLDGALGTEIERRGLPAGLPLWSTHALLEAPEAVRAIHAEYVEAGAEILTANTFRTQRRTLARARDAALADRAREITRLALDLAREAASACEPRPFVAGSAPPLEDCYRPDLAPDEATARREHEEHAHNLAEAGADLLLLETMNSVAEARAASAAAAATGLPFAVCFVCSGEARLLSGERLADAIEAVAAHGPSSVGVNCLPPAAVAASLPVLAASGLPFSVHANLGAPDPAKPGRRTHEHEAHEFAEQAQRWIDAGARIVGGCCGTRPAHITAISARIDGLEARTGRR